MKDTDRHVLDQLKSFLGSREPLNSKKLRMLNKKLTPPEWGELFDFFAQSILSFQGKTRDLEQTLEQSLVCWLHCPHKETLGPPFIKALSPVGESIFLFYFSHRRKKNSLAEHLLFSAGVHLLCRMGPNPGLESYLLSLGNHDDWPVRLSLLSHFAEAGYRNKKYDSFDKLFQRYGYTSMEFLFFLYRFSGSRPDVVLFLGRLFPLILCSKNGETQEILYHAVRHFTLKSPKNVLRFYRSMGSFFIQEPGHPGLESFLHHLDGLVSFSLTIRQPFLGFDLFMEIHRFLEVTPKAQNILDGMGQNKKLKKKMDQLRDQNSPFIPWIQKPPKEEPIKGDEKDPWDVLLALDRWGSAWIHRKRG